MVISTSLHHSVHFGCHILERNQDVITPQNIRDAAGIVVLEHIKGAFIFSGHVATGFVSKRLGPNLWSYPSSVFLAGAGVGIQAGAQKADVIILLNDADQVSVFERSGQLSFGFQNAASVGPAGFDLQADVRGSRGGVTACISASSAMGAFVGISVDGTVISTNYFANRFFYGKGHHIKKILNNQIKPSGKHLHDCINLNEFLCAFGNDDLVGRTARILPLNDEEYEEEEEVTKVKSDKFLDDDERKEYTAGDSNRGGKEITLETPQAVITPKATSS